MPARLALFGVGSMLDRCLEFASQTQGFEPILAVNTGPAPSRRTQLIAKKEGAMFEHCIDVNDELFVDMVEDLNLDYIISADNMKVFKDRLLGSVIGQPLTQDA